MIIPVYNGASSLPDCLDAVHRSQYRKFECLVADDGSTDASRDVAAQSGARILLSETRQGPACARNAAAAVARGDILLFIDADVRIEPDTMTKIAKAFAENAGLDALIGSYDDNPAAPNFVSQYKNLVHCYFHQQAKPKASTFWTGCGAIRREVFLASGGFDEHYSRPCIEDIELGARIIRADRRIELEPSLAVKHLKRWTFFGLLKSDIRDRAIPWTLLMLRERQIPNDLNTQWSQRISVLLAYLALSAAVVFWPASAVAVALVIAINRRFYSFLIRRRGLLFGLMATPFHFLYFFYSGAAFAAACVIWGWRPCLRVFRNRRNDSKSAGRPAASSRPMDNPDTEARDSSVPPQVSVLAEDMTEHLSK